MEEKEEHQGGDQDRRVQKMFALAMRNRRKLLIIVACVAAVATGSFWNRDRRASGDQEAGPALRHGLDDFRPQEQEVEPFWGVNLKWGVGAAGTTIVHFLVRNGAGLGHVGSSLLVVLSGYVGNIADRFRRTGARKTERILEHSERWRLQFNAWFWIIVVIFVATFMYRALERHWDRVDRRRAHAD